MATVSQVAKASLQRILVQADESPLEPSEYQDFIFAMNNLMLDLDAKGINLGYTEVANLGDSITIPNSCLRGLISVMAVEVSPDYNRPIPEALAAQAAAGLKTFRRVGTTIRQTEYPSTLPRGAGNYNDTFRDDHFFPDLQDDILTESGNAILLENDTQ